LLLSGATYGHVYWDFPLNSPLYSYVQALTAAGNATFNIDRIGIGASDHPPADQVTIQAGAWVAHQIVQALRDGRIGTFSKVILVGHSLGSGIALSEQATYGDANGLILTGFLHAFGPGFAEVPQLIYPAQNDPRFSSQNLPAGYFTTLPGVRKAFYFTPLADPAVIATDESTKETITIGEINTFVPLVAPPGDAPSVHVPVLFVIGSNDNIFCTPPQCSEAQSEAALYPADASVEVRIVPGSGHDLSLHFTAPIFFLIAAEWSSRHFGN
jgi:pimeloyl-ACP methyl ester carboxylesterase